MFDLSAMLASTPGAAISGVRTTEDGSDAFAMLQINLGNGAGAEPEAAHWVSIAQLDGVRAGDAVNVLLDPAHLAQLHAGVLI
jgi:hypothetical protein